MNGFEKHGIKHLSASSINMYTNAPCAWVAKYLFNEKFSFANAARAGVLAEDAVTSVLTGAMTQDQAIEFATKAYMKEIALGGSDSDRKRGDGIEGFVLQALEVLRPYGKPSFEGLPGINAQKQIELLCKTDTFEMPLTGFLDYYYPEQNLVIDLKTTMRMPSEMSFEHIVQGCIYKKAMNSDVKFLYVTPKKSCVFDIENEDEVLAKVKKNIIRMEKMLRHDASDIKDMIPVAINSYYWSGDENLRNQIYGI